MKKASQVALFIMICISFPRLLYAQENDRQSDHALLWRISGDNLQQSSYLFGTIHVICASDYLWTPVMQADFSKSDKVCFEMDLDDTALLMQVALGAMDMNKELRDYFSPADYKMVSRYLTDSLGISEMVFAHMKPVFVQTMMEVKKSIGCPDPISYEDSLSRMAIAQHKEIQGLEAAQEQLDALGTIAIDSTVQDIKDQAYGRNTQDAAQYAQMLSAYKQQNLPLLYQLITQSPDAGEDMGPLLDERNKKWIPRITEKMKHSSVFFAVGAGHLYGADGVIALLRKAGYEVIPQH